MLDATSKKRKLNAYELANVYNTYAFLRYAVEDYTGALNYYRKVIVQRPQIPIALEVGTLFTIAQLYFLQEDWQKGIDTLKQWMARIALRGRTPHEPFCVKLRRTLPLRR